MILPIRERLGRTGAEWRLHTASRWPVHSPVGCLSVTQIARPAFHRVTDLFYEMARRPGHRDAPPCPRLYWVLTRRVPRTSSYTLRRVSMLYWDPLPFYGRYKSSPGGTPAPRIYRYRFRRHEPRRQTWRKERKKEKRERKEDRKASRSRSPRSEDRTFRYDHEDFDRVSLLLRWFSSLGSFYSLRTISVFVAASPRTIGRWLSEFQIGWPAFQIGTRRFFFFRNRRFLLNFAILSSHLCC